MLKYEQYKEFHAFLNLRGMETSRMEVRSPKPGVTQKQREAFSSLAVGLQDSVPPCHCICECT